MKQKFPPWWNKPKNSKRVEMDQVDIGVTLELVSITPDLDVSQVPPVTRVTQARSTPVLDPSKAVVDYVGDETGSMS